MDRGAVGGGLLYCFVVTITDVCVGPFFVVPAWLVTFRRIVMDAASNIIPLVPIIIQK